MHDTPPHNTSTYQIWFKMVARIRRYCPDKIRRADTTPDGEKDTHRQTDGVGIHIILKDGMVLVGEFFYTVKCYEEKGFRLLSHQGDLYTGIPQYSQITYGTSSRWSLLRGSTVQPNNLQRLIKVIFRLYSGIPQYGQITCGTDSSGQVSHYFKQLYPEILTPCTVLLSDVFFSKFAI